MSKPLGRASCSEAHPGVPQADGVRDHGRVGRRQVPGKRKNAAAVHFKGLLHTTRERFDDGDFVHLAAVGLVAANGDFDAAEGRIGGARFRGCRTQCHLETGRGLIDDLISPRGLS